MKRRLVVPSAPGRAEALYAAQTLIALLYADRHQEPLLTDQGKLAVKTMVTRLIDTHQLPDVPTLVAAHRASASTLTTIFEIADGDQT